MIFLPQNMLIYALCRQLLRFEFTQFLSWNPPECKDWGAGGGGKPILAMSGFSRLLLLPPLPYWKQRTSNKQRLLIYYWKTCKTKYRFHQFGWNLNIHCLKDVFELFFMWLEKHICFDRSYDGRYKFSNWVDKVTCHFMTLKLSLTNIKQKSYAHAKLEFLPGSDQRSRISNKIVEGWKLRKTSWCFHHRNTYLYLY